MWIHNIWLDSELTKKKMSQNPILRSRSNYSRRRSRQGAFEWRKLVRTHRLNARWIDVFWWPHLRRRFNAAQLCAGLPAAAAACGSPPPLNHTTESSDSLLQTVAGATRCARSFTGGKKTKSPPVSGFWRTNEAILVSLSRTSAPPPPQRSSSRIAHIQPVNSSMTYEIAVLTVLFLSPWKESTLRAGPGVEKTDCGLSKDRENCE